MSYLNPCGFFTTVRDDIEYVNSSLSGKCERLADALRVPGQWVAYSLWNGGVKHVSNSTGLEEEGMRRTRGWRRPARLVAGLALSLFCHLGATLAMAIAFTSKEIRLKHRMAVLPPLDNTALNEYRQLRTARLTPAQEVEKCEPVSICLAGIGAVGVMIATAAGCMCCMMCFLVCCK